MTWRAADYLLAETFHESRSEVTPFLLGVGLSP